LPHRVLFRSTVLIVLAGAAVAPLEGCILAAGAAGVGTGYALTQERSISDTVRDAGIHAAISQSWKQYNVKLADDLDNTVYEGRVLITGQVPSEEWRAAAVKRTWQVQGVKAVYDEITIGPDEGFMRDVSDDTITSKLKAQLIADADVKSINYTITTVQGVVYLLGTARSPAELQRVIDHARNIANVKNVISYVKIREGMPAAAPSPAAPGAPASAPPPPATAAPAALQPNSLPPPPQPIEATPLK